MKVLKIFIWIFIYLLIFVFFLNKKSVTVDFIRIKNKHLYNHPELSHFKSLLITLNPIYAKNVSMGFIDTNTEVIGSCNFVIFPPSIEIDIDINHWKSMTFEEKLFLLAHEMIHCVCKNFYHNRDHFIDGCPATIFSERAPNLYCIQRYYLDYVNSVKNACQN